MVYLVVKVNDLGVVKDLVLFILGILDIKGQKWQLNGYNKVYNFDGEIWQDGIFKNGKLWDGKVYVYDCDGIFLKVKVYKEGVYYFDGQF